jgi:hypothetical protein
VLALGLSIALFAYWLIVGYALVSALHSQRNLLQNLLLAPVIGLIAGLLPVYWLNRLGLPTDRFGLPLMLLLLCASLISLWRVRPYWPLRAYLPFGVVLGIALLVTGWPMLRFGFDWLAFANDDMANYTLWAFRFQHHGFLEVPSLPEIASGRDYSLFYWLYELIVSRPGAMLLLAWVASVTGLTSQQVYMPLTLGANLVLISAAGALVLQNRRWRVAAIATCSLLALSALMTLGAMYQLIPQIVGLALLASAAALLLRPPPASLTGRAKIREGILLGMLIAGLPLVYTEVLPILVLAFGLYTAVALVQRHYAIKALLIWLVTATAFALVALNRFTLEALAYLWMQVVHSSAPGNPDSSLFPYYLLPSGVANLWGFLPIETPAFEPWTSIAIIAGAVLLAVAALMAIGLAWRKQPVAIVTLVMLLLLARLFAQRADFGLFKLAMFLQPFLLGTLVVGWFSIVRRPVLRLVPLVALALAGIYTQVTYMEFSTGEGGVFVEVPQASRSHINSEFREIMAQHNDGDLVLDTANTVLAKFQVLHARGTSLNFASRDFFIPQDGDPAASVAPQLALRFFNIRDTLVAKLLDARFNWPGDSVAPEQAQFQINTLGEDDATPEPCDTLIANTGQQSIVNRWHLGDSPGNFAVLPCRDLRNHLIFTHTPIGAHYQSADDRHHALFGLEPDILVPGQTMAGLGRYLVFQVMNPTAEARLVLDLTTTLNADGDNSLPPAAAIGTNRESFPLVGRGAARVISPPLTPQTIDGRSWVAIDMGIDGRRFPKERTGLMSLYGTDVPLDRRRLNAFGRDISMIGADEYARLVPPSSVSSFPADLRQRDLEFSGIYDDGWIADAAYLILTQPDAPAPLAVRGVVPSLGDSGFTTTLRLSIDGREVAQQVLRPGDFDLRVVPPSAPGRHRVDLSFSAISQIHPSSSGERDNRPVSARLQFVGFTTADDVVAPGSALGLGANWDVVDRQAGEAYRWVHNDAELLVPPSTAENRVLSLDVEPNLESAAASQNLQLVNAQGRTLASAELAGRQKVDLTVPATANGPEVWHLHVADDAPPAAGEPPASNFRIFQIGWAVGGAGYSPAALSKFNAADDIGRPGDWDALQRGEFPPDGLVLGKGWYGIEGGGESRFRWAENGAELVVTAPTGLRRNIRLDVEPILDRDAPPTRFRVSDEHGDIVASAELGGRQSVTLTLPLTPGTTSAFRLSTEAAAVSPPSDERRLNFRVFRVAWAGEAAIYTPAALMGLSNGADISPSKGRDELRAGRLPADGLFAGYGWYPFERFGSDTFRWVDNDAEVVVTAPTAATHTLRLEVEPGPGLGGQPLDLQVLDDQGRTLVAPRVIGRQSISVPLTLTPGRESVLRLHTDGGGATVSNDPRILNFRVFELSLD